MSAGGRFVSFWAVESQLIKGVHGGNYFVYDRQKKQLEVVAEGTGYKQGKAFCNPPQNIVDKPWFPFLCPQSGIFIHDVPTNTSDWVSQSDNTYARDESLVVFASQSNSLVPNDFNKCESARFGLHDCVDIFLYDAKSGHTEIISRSNDEKPSNGDSHTVSISNDGQWIVFASSASNLTAEKKSGIFLYERENSRLKYFPGGAPRISADGRWVAFMGQGGVNLYERETGKLKLITGH